MHYRPKSLTKPSSADFICVKPSNCTPVCRPLALKPVPCRAFGCSMVLVKTFIISSSPWSMLLMMALIIVSSSQSFRNHRRIQQDNIKCLTGDSQTTCRKLNQMLYSFIQATSMRRGCPRQSVFPVCKCGHPLFT